VDTRQASGELAGRGPRRLGSALLRLAICVAAASLLAWLPEHPGLDDAGRASLWILLLAAGLWISEAIPAFAVALLVIGLQIVVLGDPAGAGADGWRTFTDPWAAPPMWLFLAGLVMAKAAERAGIARWMAERALALTRGRGPLVLGAAMAITFAFSMFISNTATTALMVAVLGPMLAAAGGASSRGRRGLLVGVAFAANIGGMATVIGTPPNAIAAGLLTELRAVSFLDWMLLGLPPALLVAGALGTVLAAGRSMRAASFAVAPGDGPAGEPVPPWQRLGVMLVFSTTVVLWLSEAWHGLPAAVVAFLPIVTLSAMGVIRRDEVRTLPWDVLILIAGGLSLGVGVAESGLAAWLAGGIATVAAPPWAIALGLCYLATLLSNLMSNTAAANLLLPIGIALGLELGGPLLAAQLAVPIALAASTAMCLPISTPPNAIVHATGAIDARDLLRGGVAVGLVTPALAVAWCFPVLAWWG
jgi:sodium-dependent dicarboxylate transporter 2/3/5